MFKHEIGSTAASSAGQKRLTLVRKGGARPLYICYIFNIYGNSGDVMYDVLYGERYPGGWRILPENRDIIRQYYTLMIGSTISII